LLRLVFKIKNKSQTPTTMKVKNLLLTAIFCSTYSFAQVGVGTTTPEGALDVSSTTSGFVPPRVALTALNVAAPVVNPQGGLPATGTIVWNTTNNLSIPFPLPNEVSPGMYYWDGARWVSLAGSPGGLDWSIIGNGGIDGGITGTTTPLVAATQGTHFIGTYDATNMDIRTAGLHAARVSQFGEFFIGGLETVLPGDLMNGISEGNALFPWAVNGYTDQDGAGTYGRVSGGTTNFGAIQGEYAGTGTNATGVRGIYETTAGGAALNTHTAGVKGSLFFNGGTFSAQNFAFGISGTSLANSGRTVGGVYGTNTNNATYGMLGYERSNGNNCGVLTSVAIITGASRTTSNTNTINTSIGIAAQGGFLGSHVKGNQFGLITKGDLVGQYTDGSSISNKGYAVVNTTKEGNKTITYAATSTTVDVSTKGTGKLVNGSAKIAFDANYSQLTAKDKPVIVTVTPMGETKGVYIAEVTNDGFIVKENGNGTSNASFYWIAIGEKNNASELNVPAELLATDFDANLDSFLTIDENNNNSKAMWWNGTSLEFGKDAPNEAHEGTAVLNSNERPKGEAKPKKENLRASQIKEITKK